jgi:hypothetical protein
VPNRSLKPGIGDANLVNPYDICKLLDEFNIEKYFDSKLHLMKDEEDQSGTGEEILYTLYLAEGKGHDCPRV